jgi:proton glutamate symport protein
VDVTATARVVPAGDGNGDKPRVGSSALIVLALGLGVAVGLFFGEYCAVLSLVGDAFVGLLQMTVLPYIVFSLIANLGRLSLAESKRLAFTGIAVMMLLWGIGAAVVVLMPFALPEFKTGAFFSTSLIEPVAEVDFFSLFIPSNPFSSLANNFAPAVVVFCLFFGFALTHVSGKESMLSLLDVINSTLSRVNHYIVKLSPIGIFAISASATGTLTVEVFERMQAYLLIYIGGVLLLAFWVLPMLVSAFTPFRFRDILRSTGNVLITSFVVGSVFIVIPMLVESVRELFERHRNEGLGGDLARGHSDPEFVIPLAYPFPHLGKLVTLIFVPFSAWFYGEPFALGDYPAFLATGLFLSFGKVTTTIPFLLEMQEIPADIFQLFLMSSVVAGRFNDLLGAMHLVAFTVLTICALSGLLRARKRRLLWATFATVVLCVVLVGGTQRGLHASFADAATREKIVARMQLIETQAPATILAYGEPNPNALRADEQRLQRVMKSATIRIGFHPDNLPFSYYNASDKLVGFDVDMAHRLARDLGVAIEFVPFNFATLAEQLEDDHFDIAMSGIALTVQRSRSFPSTPAYLSVNLALVVRDHEKRRFLDLGAVSAAQPLAIGVETDTYFGAAIRAWLPNVTLVELWSESEFFEGPPQHMDALATTAEAGSAWTLLFPEYSVLNPFKRKTRIPLVYPYAARDGHLGEFLESWIELKKHDGTVQSLYDYWILGRGAQIRQPRWSVLRNVLGWVE